jgi:hypothetical protein
METHADDRRCSSGSFEEWTEEQLEVPQKRAAEEYDSFVALGNFPSMASYLVWSSWRDSTVEVGSGSPFKDSPSAAGESVIFVAFVLPLLFERAVSGIIEK